MDIRIIGKMEVEPKELLEEARGEVVLMCRNVVWKVGWMFFRTFCSGSWTDVIEYLWMWK